MMMKFTGPHAFARARHDFQREADAVLVAAAHSSSSRWFGVAAMNSLIR